MGIGGLAIRERSTCMTSALSKASPSKPISRVLRFLTECPIGEQYSTHNGHLRHGHLCQALC